MAIFARTLLCATACLAALAPGCATESANDRVRTELAHQRALFAQTGLTSYVLTEQRSCFCDPDSTMAMRVSVTDGSVTGAMFVADQQPVPDAIRGQLMTIPQVFDLIETELDAGMTTVTVTYDAALHYPTLVSSASRIPDSGLSVSLTDLATSPVALSHEACTGIENAARAAVLPAIEAHVACKVASDCSHVQFAASCFASCFAVVGTGGAAAVQAAEDAVETTQCVAYHSGGCKLVPPPCAAPVAELYCTLGACTSVPPK